MHSGRGDGQSTAVSVSVLAAAGTPTPTPTATKTPTPTPTATPTPTPAKTPTPTPAKTPTRRQRQQPPHPGADPHRDRSIDGHPHARSGADATDADPGRNGSTNPTPLTLPGTVLTETVRPSGKLKVVGTVRRGGKVTVRVSASDASGIRHVTIAVGKGRPKVGATRTITLPRKAGRLVLTAVIVDTAGNATTLTRILKLR